MRRLKYDTAQVLRENLEVWPTIRLIKYNGMKYTVTGTLCAVRGDYFDAALNGSPEWEKALDGRQYEFTDWGNLSGRRCWRLAATPSRCPRQAKKCGRSRTDTNMCFTDMWRIDLG